MPPLYIVVVAGPNGAGKSTSAASLIEQDIEFLNADEIAKRLPGPSSPAKDIQAGRYLLQEILDREARRVSFALETNLAGKTLVSRIIRLKSLGYHFHLIFLWTPSPEFSIRRVQERVQLGGHDVPEGTIRRRHSAGLRNLFKVYLPMADSWCLYDNTDRPGPRRIAERRENAEPVLVDCQTWELMNRSSKEERSNSDD